MTLLFIDGFDHYSTTQLVDKKWGYANVGISSTYGRFGGYGFGMTSSSGNYGYKNLPANKSTIFFGIAIKKAEEGTPAYTSTLPLIRFRDESGITQVKFYLLADYSIAAYQGDDTLLGTTSAGVFRDLAWQYLEAKITVSATVGEVILRINGSTVLNLTSQDTKNGSDYIRQIWLAAIYNSKNTYFDDMYVDDTQFHGDCRVKTFVPDSISGTNNSFTASAGNKDECVDEIPSNEDTDYIVSDTLNHKQTFGITTGVLGTVKAIQLNNHCRLDEAGTRKITPIIRSNGTDYSGTESDEITADYLFESEIWETDPDDSGAWTQTKLEAAEFGLEITT